MFQSKTPKSSRGVRHTRKFRLRTDALRDTRCTRAFNTQLPRVIEGLHDAVRTYCIVRFGGKQTKHAVILDLLHNRI